jgi:hypothetical protein
LLKFEHGNAPSFGKENIINTLDKTMKNQRQVLN